MAKHVFFKEEFERLAVDGFIGRPDGKPAYAYIRVSSDEQGDEGRSGLPRQIEHIHQKAFEAGYCITWERVFADDFSGFELERPELSRLRREYRSQQRHALAVVMEHLDRLSRNADWHQGFLLDEMKQLRIEAVFWKSFSSRVERAVLGAVAQEGMEQAKQRMMEGTMHKARNGRVTAKKAAYGYRLVDDHGHEGDRARKFTYYAIHEERAAVVRRIYQRLTNGDSLRQIAKDLDAAKIPSPKYGQCWRGSLIGLMVRNEVYKGDYVAHRWVYVKVEKPTKDGLSTRFIKERQQRPQNEWIHVPVPAIVDAATWQAANDMLMKNQTMASRNGQHPYLLTGLVKCSDCGYSFVGRPWRSRASGKVFEGRCYTCRNTYKRMSQCHQRQISVDVLESAVWSVVCNAILEPDVLLRALEENTFHEQNAQLERQIAYLEEEIVGKHAEDDKLYRAYIAGIFDEDEYAERRKGLKAQITQYQIDLDQLYPQRVTKERFEVQKATILSFAARLHSMDIHVDLPFEIKRRIIKMTVNQIILNTTEKRFRLEGVIRGQYAIENTSVVTPSTSKSAMSKRSTVSPKKRPSP